MQLRLSLDSPEPLPPAAAAPPPGPPEPAILFVRHRRARRYILRVLEDGRLRVTLPRWGVKREALAFIAANRAWVVEQRARRQRRRETPRPARRLRPYVERWWRARAERDLPVQLRRLAAMHGIEVTRVTVRDQRSRWGACSARGSITLNWRLVLTPAFVCEYVMLHELMHRRELNHSRRFWRLVAACCPRYREARDWLNQEGKRLWADCG